MHLPALNLSVRERALLALLLFLIAWLLGNVGLIVGFELGARAPAVMVFVIACLLWWISYRISRSAEGRGMKLGFVALSVWMLGLLGELFLNFHDCIADPFFWVATTIFLLLVTAFAVSEAAPSSPKASSSPD
jgi:hypothetical protein